MTSFTIFCYILMTDAGLSLVSLSRDKSAYDQRGYGRLAQPNPPIPTARHDPFVSSVNDGLEKYFG